MLDLTGYMEFQDFSGIYALCNYFSRKTRYHDEASELINLFKQEPRFEKKVISVITRIASDGLRKIIKPDYVLRALGSKEIRVTWRKPLDYLALGIALACRAEYKPFALAKDKWTSDSRMLGTLERHLQISNTYKLDQSQIKNKSTILIVDDLTTTQATLKVILQVIKEKLPEAKCLAFVLGRSRFPYEAPSCNNENFLSDYKSYNTHDWEEYFDNLHKQLREVYKI